MLSDRHRIKQDHQAGLLVHPFNPNTWKADLLQDQDQPGLYVGWSRPVRVMQRDSFKKKKNILRIWQ